jgi:hypothetical protein
MAQPLSPPARSLLPEPPPELPAPDRDDDDLDEDLDLPPLDTDDDEPAATEGDDLPLEIEEGGGLDDSAAADLDVGEELDDLDDEDAGEPEVDVDVGALDEGIDFDEKETDLAPPVAADDGGTPDDDGIAIDESRDGDDGGAEGTSEAPEDEVDEDELPDIDDGDDVDVDRDLAETLLAEADATLPPWAPARVALLEGAGAAVPCCKVAAVAGRVAAAGEVLLFVEEGARAARRLPFAEGVVAVALADDALLAATARGQLLVQRDSEAEAAALGSWRSSTGGAVDLAATPGRFWIRAGTTLSCAALAPPLTTGAPLGELRERGVLAIAASGGALVAITMGPTGPAIERFRGDDEGGMEAPLGGPARGVVERGREALLLAVGAGGRCLAIGDGERVAVSRDGGATFTLFEPGPAVAITFAGDEPGAPLLALVIPVSTVSAVAATATVTPAFLVQVSAAGEAVRIGELASVEPPAAIAWDTTREVIWVASGAGLVALGMPRRH